MASFNILVVFERNYESLSCYSSAGAWTQVFRNYDNRIIGVHKRKISVMSTVFWNITPWSSTTWRRVPESLTFTAISGVITHKVGRSSECTVLNRTKFEFHPNTSFNVAQSWTFIRIHGVISEMTMEIIIVNTARTSNTNRDTIQQVNARFCNIAKPVWESNVVKLSDKLCDRWSSRQEQQTGNANASHTRSCMYKHPPTQVPTSSVHDTIEAVLNQAQVAPY
jgi:hypothetical protein